MVELGKRIDSSRSSTDLPTVSAATLACLDYNRRRHGKIKEAPLALSEMWPRVRLSNPRAFLRRDQRRAASRQDDAGDARTLWRAGTLAGATWRLQNHAGEDVHHVLGSPALRKRDRATASVVAQRHPRPRAEGRAHSTGNQDGAETPFTSNQVGIGGGLRTTGQAVVERRICEGAV